MFKKPLHCYSKYLIGSLPRIGDKAYRISASNPPVLNDPLLRLLFSGSLSDCSDRCCKETPPLREVEEGHKVACFRVFDEMGVS